VYTIEAARLMCAERYPAARKLLQMALDDLDHAESTATLKALDTDGRAVQ
jgi:hypothetical protein